MAWDPSPHSRPATLYPTSPSIEEEFFDCPSSSQKSMTGHDEEALTSYLIFESIVEEEVNIEASDWRGNDSPQVPL